MASFVRRSPVGLLEVPEVAASSSAVASAPAEPPQEDPAAGRKDRRRPLVDWSVRASYAFYSTIQDSDRYCTQCIQCTVLYPCTGYAPVLSLSLSVDLMYVQDAARPDAHIWAESNASFDVCHVGDRHCLVRVPSGISVYSFTSAHPMTFPITRNHTCSLH